MGEYVADYAFRERDLEGWYDPNSEKSMTRTRTRIADAVGSSPVPPGLMDRGSRSRSRTRALEQVIERHEGMEMAERPRGRGDSVKVTSATHNGTAQLRGGAEAREESQETTETKY